MFMQQPQLIELSTTEGRILINPEEILFIESIQRKRVIHTYQEKYVSYKSLEYMESMLNQGYFARTHRSFIVNLKKIEKIVPYCRTSNKIVFYNYDEYAYISKKYGHDLF
ncbi:MAG: LytTR family DNA-binding domain-containing protein [Bacillota bacterium]|nr:LytTR family DNA-binding domain-containing protein [Bacillota bacterium]